MVTTDIQVTVIQAGDGIIKVKQNGREETYYLSRFARFDWLPQPGETVILKLDKRNFVREIRRPEQPANLAEELAQAISSEMNRYQNQLNRLQDPDFLLRVMHLAIQVAGRDEDEESVIYWADLILGWVQERLGKTA